MCRTVTHFFCWFSPLGTLLLLAVCMPSAAVGQGFLISPTPNHQYRLPRPTPQPTPQPGFLYDVTKLEIDAFIRGQVAEVQVAQTFHNCSGRTMHVKFVFPLPYDGAVDQMTFLVDGEELEGRLLEVDQARQIYQSYVRRSQDPALVQWIGTGMFQTQVFPVPAGAERTVSLRYTQLCRRNGTSIDWLLPLSPTKFTTQPIGEIAIRGRIRSETRIGNLYSPSHEIEIERDGDQVARFAYLAKKQVPKRDFRVLWDTGDSPVQLSLVTHRADSEKDGYFMLMVQPKFPEVPSAERRAGKNVILVMDKSGSMRGEKIDQARRAASYVVQRLKNRDRFTLINYDSRVEIFRSELTDADKVTRADAEEYIDSMLAGGSTNIDEALKQTLRMAEGADGPLYVVFMTDGQPTVGEKNAMKIAANAKQRLGEGVRLFSLGVGHDVNSRLLDKLASICLGKTSYVRPDEPLDDVISRLYDRIGAPALTNAKLRLTVDGKEGRVRQIYPADMYDLFSGDQLVIVGRYRKHGSLKVELSGDFLGTGQKYVFEDELPKVTSSGNNVFVERLWATRRIGEIIDEIDLEGENKELVDELIALSKRYGILTPYTAYLDEEKTDLNDISQGRRIAGQRLERLNEEAGESAFNQRRFKGMLRSAGRAADPASADMAMGPLRSAPAPAAGDLGGGVPIDRFGDASAARPSVPNEPIILGSNRKEAQVERDASVSRVKQIGSKIFYWRGDRYIDSEATKAQIDKVTEVVQFSDKYFDMLREIDEAAKAYLAEDTDVLVVIQGRAYLIKKSTAGDSE
ncbi:MAG: VIT domain-containing protein [Planctomycetota bacterium]|nr:VIT domain-containing protein [Planctomycetota bacterium]